MGRSTMRIWVGGFYFECENGHVWEVITHTYVTD